MEILFIFYIILFILIIGIISIVMMKLILKESPELLKGDKEEIEDAIFIYDNSNVVNKIKMVIMIGGIMIANIFHGIVNFKIRKRK